MLVLSRKYSEAVVVNGPCRISVVEIRGDKVRLGFEADPAVTIHREEVAKQIEKEESRRARAGE